MRSSKPEADPAPVSTGTSVDASTGGRFLVLPGVWGALVLAWSSFTPSLLPRGAITQGLVGGISAAIGYGLGVLIAVVWRALVDREARPGSPRVWRSTAVIGMVGTLAALLVGRAAQREMLALMGSAPSPAWRVVLTPVVMVAVATTLVGASRGVRSVTRALTRSLGRRIGPRAAPVLGGLLVALSGFLLVTGVLFDGLIGVADQAFAVRDTTTAEGVEPTDSQRRSGGPGSLIDWDSLGRQGRSFVTGGPSMEELTAFRGRSALEPIRIYAGMATEMDVELRARRAVDDLERAGGFDRSHLLVATTTGTGWLDPGTMAALEYVTDGDAAIVTMQYSYLPSWLSYLVDQVRARQAGRELFDAVYERWVERPPDARPELLVFGESLGSFGAEAAFSGEFDLRNRTSGALFVGAPGFNVLHREFTEGRDPGSHQIAPTYRAGRTVRFSDGRTIASAESARPWDGPRVLYLQHPSDPITWWDVDLLLRRPDWLEEPRGHDVLDGMVWFPFVTFWQVTGDLPFAVDVPDGHGHRYTQGSVDAWTAILRPDDWSQQDAERLRGLVAR